MKKWQILLSIVVAFALLLGVIFATPIIAVFNSSPGTGEPVITVPDGFQEFNLWAGQTFYAGDGEVFNDGDLLNFTIDPLCAIYKIDVRIFENAPTIVNPAPGRDLDYHFDYAASPKTSEFDFEIPFVPSAWTTPVYIAIHADAACGFYNDQTAWASAATIPEESDRFPGPQWAYYFEFAY